jgi:carboxymethylenebutenolidase
MDLQRYILTEWTEEYKEGRMGRREFLRRVVLMSGGAALALPVLSGLGVPASAAEVSQAAASSPPAVAQASGVTVSPTDPAIQARDVSFPQGATQMLAYLAEPRTGTPTPGVLVIHENRGMLEHFKDVARRFAKVGYVALAVDLASREGGTARFTDPAQVSALLGRTPEEQLVAMLNAGVAHLQGLSTVRRDRVGAMGFCFGGGMTWRLATANASLRAAVPYYGANPPLADVAKIKAAVLAIYGARDTFINPGIPAVRQAMERAGVTHEVVIYPDADHAFFNDTSPRYNAAAAQQAWQRTLAWFERYLKAA